jgi:hypothetical protein
MSGTTSVQFHQSRTRDHVDLAGLSQLWALLNPTGIFLERAKTLPSLSNNWLIVLETLTITVAVEVYPLMLLSTFDMLVELRVMLLILILPRTELVCSEDQFLLDM